MGLAIFKRAQRLQGGTEAVPSELPTPPEPPEAYQSPVVRSLIDQVRQGILPDEALDEIKRDPTSLRSLASYAGAALSAGTLLSGGGEKLQLGGEKLPAPHLEFGDKANAQWHIKNAERLIPSNEERIRTGKAVNPQKLQQQIEESKAMIERAKAFISDPNAQEIKRVFKKQWTPTWNQDADVARYFRDDAIKHVQKNFPEVHPDAVAKSVDDNLESLIEAHRADNEGERMGHDFWDEAIQGIAGDIEPHDTTQTQPNAVPTVRPREIGTGTTEEPPLGYVRGTKIVKGYPPGHMLNTL